MFEEIGKWSASLELSCTPGSTDNSTHEFEASLESYRPGPYNEDEMNTKTLDHGQENSLQAGNDRDRSEHVAA